jgi:hypothetical protein
VTLILTWVDHRKIVQVSDQRLTLPDDTPVDEQTLKTVCVESCDASFMLSYTGAAYMPTGTRMDRWLLDAVEQHLDLPLPKLIQSLHADLQRCATRNTPLAVVGSGYPHSSDWAFVFRISNCHNEHDRVLTSPVPFFQVRWWLPKIDRLNRARVLLVTGAELAIRRSLRRHMERAARKDLAALDPRTCSDRLTSFIRAAARSPKYGKYIGENCVGAILRASEGFEGTYYPSRSSRRAQLPHFIQPGLTFAGITIKDGGGPPSPSVSMEFSDWPQLSANITRVDDFVITVSNTDSVDWTDVRCDLNGRPQDYRQIADGWDFGPGYVYTFPFLAARSTISLGLASFLKLADRKAFDPRIERVADLVMIARLPTGEYGRYITGAI